MTECPASVYCWASVPMVVVVPEPLTPHTNTTCGFKAWIKDQRLGRGFQDDGNVAGEGFAHIQIADFLVEAIFGQLRGQLGGRRNADISGDQSVFQIFQNLVVQATLAGKQRADRSGELA